MRVVGAITRWLGGTAAAGGSRLRWASLAEIGKVRHDFGKAFAHVGSSLCRASAGVRTISARLGGLGSFFFTTVSTVAAQPLPPPLLATSRLWLDVERKAKTPQPESYWIFGRTYHTYGAKNRRVRLLEKESHTNGVPCPEQGYPLFRPLYYLQLWEYGTTRTTTYTNRNGNKDPATR